MSAVLSSQVKPAVVVGNDDISTRVWVLFAWLISHQPAVLFSQNKSVTSNQPAVLFSQNKPAPAISHQPTEQPGCGRAPTSHPNRPSESE
jgi:hypothetical protein